VVTVELLLALTLRLTAALLDKRSALVTVWVEESVLTAIASALVDLVVKIVDVIKKVII